MTTWREMIGYEMSDQGDSWENVVGVALPDPPPPEEYVDWESSLDAVFDAGFGAVEGCPFTLWTIRRVYFPVVYDGSESVASVSRQPDGIATYHVGGG